MNKSDKLLSYSLAGALGYFGAVELTRYTFAPKHIYTIGLNGDAKSDLVVVNRGQTKTVFLQQEDGTFIELSTLLDIKATGFDTDKKAIKDSIEAKIKDLK